jgi:hypothetical protein
MKVKLINVAEYEIKDGKTNDIPFNTFVNLCGGVGTGKTDTLPKVRLFKTMDEFIDLSTDEMEEIDQNLPIKILSNGQFLVFLKGMDKKENNTKSKENATTNTKENTTK